MKLSPSWLRDARVGRTAPKRAGKERTHPRGRFPKTDITPNGRLHGRCARRIRAGATAVAPKMSMFPKDPGQTVGTRARTRRVSVRTLPRVECAGGLA